MTQFRDHLLRFVIRGSFNPAFFTAQEAIFLIFAISELVVDALESVAKTGTDMLHGTTTAALKKIFRN